MSYVLETPSGKKKKGGRGPNCLAPRGKEKKRSHPSDPPVKAPSVYYRHGADGREGERKGRDGCDGTVGNPAMLEEGKKRDTAGGAPGAKSLFDVNAGEVVEPGRGKKKKLSSPGEIGKRWDSKRLSPLQTFQAWFARDGKNTALLWLKRVPATLLLLYHCYR